MNIKKVKLIVFIILFFLLVTFLTTSLFEKSLSNLSVDEIKNTRILDCNLVNNIKINNRDTVYDKKNNIYYYTISEDYENKDYFLKIELDNGYKYRLVDSESNLINVDYGDLIDVIIYNKKYYCQTKIQLTNLSLVSIVDNSDITTSVTKANFKYIPSNETEDMINSNIMINIRGATAQHFPKKSYKIKMYNRKYTSEENTQISDFYYGSSYILDAVYRDPSKIRNVLSMELWNDISNDFSDVDIKSEFVELFVNNEYRGLYVLMEPINRKSLKLKQSTSDDTSILIKSNDYDMDKIEYDDFINANEQFYRHFEMKYPNNNNLFNRSWVKLFTQISDYYNESLPYTYDIIDKAFNMENYIDIMLFNAFINNTDCGLAKNLYFYIKSISSNEVYMQPWDMEYSFGLNYLYTAKNYTYKDLNDYNKIKQLFFLKGVPEINQLLINRYWELREDIIENNYFDNLLDNYLNKLNKGATLRDSNLWDEYDIETEIEDIRTWIHNRISFFDGYVSDFDE